MKRLRLWNGYKVWVPVEQAIDIEDWEVLLKRICPVAFNGLVMERKAYEGTTKEWKEGDWTEGLYVYLATLSPQGYEFDMKDGKHGYWKD